jgi:Protein of unknown function (DUF1385)/CBS domain
MSPIRFTYQFIMPKNGHTIRVIKDRLIQPVGRFMRPCVTIEDFSSVHLAVERMREAGQEMIPVTHDGQLCGALTQASIIEILGQDASKDEAVGTFAHQVPTISNQATGSEALRQLENQSTLIVVDNHNAVCGILTPSCFIASPYAPERPHMVGGMATPFGVYLTTGSVRGGKYGWYLFSTGIFLMIFFNLGNMAMSYLTKGLPNTWLVGLAVNMATALVMLSIFRLLPIAGYHAAEHMVVHALERDEELTPEVVARMPRVHPRCGTNLAVAVTMFTTIAFTPWIKEEEPRIAVAMLVTLFFWRSVGSFTQYWFTTKVPNQKHIASGVAAGKELLDNYATAANRAVTPFTRIINSGMLHVIAGSLAALGIAWLIGRAFGVELILS